MSKTFWQILQTAWRKANQPIPGTEEDRSKWVIVEGRYPSLQMAPMKVKVIFIVLCILLGLCTYLLTHFLFPALSNVIKSNMCVEGWFGKSLGSQISILWLLLLFLIISGISAYGFVRGCRTWRQRRDIPEGRRPLFSTRLIEGKKAVILGLCQMVLGVALCIAIFYINFRIVSLLWLPPSEMKECKSLQHHQKTVLIQGNSP